MRAGVERCHDILFSTIQNDLPKLKDFVYRLGAILALP